MLDYADSPIWAMDEEANAKFGYNVNLQNLELHPDTVAHVETMITLYWAALNPVYQGFPSFWSGKMTVFFQMLVRQVYAEIEIQTAGKFEIFNWESELMNDKIDVDQIDDDLKEFIDNPSKYADTIGIIYQSQSRDELKEEIQNAYQAWKAKELNWTAMQESDETDCTKVT